jgi:hypothetical protein
MLPAEDGLRRLDFDPTTKAATINTRTLATVTSFFMVSSPRED